MTGKRVLVAEDETVMLTAYGDRDAVSRAVASGVFGYAVKPFRDQDLLPAPETALARHAELAATRRLARTRIDVSLPGGAA